MRVVRKQWLCSVQCAGVGDNNGEQAKEGLQQCNSDHESVELQRTCEPAVAVRREGESKREKERRGVTVGSFKMSLNRHKIEQVKHTVNSEQVKPVVNFSKDFNLYSNFICI